MWYSDMQYKIAVHQQQESWESIVTLITSLFATVREIELTRRTEIKSALLNTVSNILLTIIILHSNIYKGLHADDTCTLCDTAGLRCVLYLLRHELRHTSTYKSLKSRGLA
jgi:hypothetical protein